MGDQLPTEWLEVVPALQKYIPPTTTIDRIG
jgi:hypothetical protein